MAGGRQQMPHPLTKDMFQYRSVEGHLKLQVLPQNKKILSRREVDGKCPVTWCPVDWSFFFFWSIKQRDLGGNDGTMV